MKERRQKHVDGIPIDELPEKYQEFSEQIKILREHGLGLTIGEEIIDWLQTHNGRLPRGNIKKNGKRFKVDDMSKEERKEVKLYQRWINSELKEALEVCKRNTNR